MATTINTKHGIFEIVDNGQGGTTIQVQGINVCEFPNVKWWDIDNIEKNIEKYHGLITERVKTRVGGKLVNKENAKEIIKELVQVLGDEEKGFYKSRLNQVVNKLEKTK